MNKKKLAGLADKVVQRLKALNYVMHILDIKRCGLVFEPTYFIEPVLCATIQVSASHSYKHNIHLLSHDAFTIMYIDKGLAAMFRLYHTRILHADVADLGITAVTQSHWTDVKDILPGELSFNVWLAFIIGAEL